MENTEYVEAGFVFYSQNQAQIAATENKKIQYLESKLDYSRPETVLQVYEKAIRERIFMSPVGICYLKQIHDFLENQPSLADSVISPVPVYVPFGADLRLDEKNKQRNGKAEEKEENPKRAHMRISVTLNVLLILAVVAMFAIALNASQPNILNYERAITDKYASWEQDLSKRENAVREKERQLNMEVEENLE